MSNKAKTGVLKVLTHFEPVWIILIVLSWSLIFVWIVYDTEEVEA
jgi:hypothetical protein